MIKEEAKEYKDIFEKYLIANKLRRTPERFALLNIIASFKGVFLFQDIEKKLEQEKFYISTATIYNNIKILLKCGIIIKFLEKGIAKYRTQEQKNICKQTCSMCGKEKEINVEELPNLLEIVKVKQFQKNSFTLIINGICNSCKARIKRQTKETK